LGIKYDSIAPYDEWAPYLPNEYEFEELAPQRIQYWHLDGEMDVQVVPAPPEGMTADETNRMSTQDIKHYLDPAAEMPVLFGSEDPQPPFSIVKEPMIRNALFHPAGIEFGGLGDSFSGSGADFILPQPIIYPFALTASDIRCAQTTQTPVCHERYGRSKIEDGALHHTGQVWLNKESMDKHLKSHDGNA
jgi:hypothetical protein